MTTFEYYTVIDGHSHHCTHPFIQAIGVPVGETLCGKRVANTVFTERPTTVPECPDCNRLNR